MRIELSNAVMRSWTIGDADALALHANNRSIWRNMNDSFPHPFTEADAHAYIAKAQHDTPERRFAIEIDGEAAGAISLHPREDVHAHSAEVGCWIGEVYWNRDIASDAMRAICTYGFATLGLRRIYAHVFEWNPASMRMLEKAGWQFEGRLRQSAHKDGQTVDEFVYAILAHDQRTADIA
jgi:RimJ/RimL family protein N-acetyltransferase